MSTNNTKKNGVQSKPEQTTDPESTNNPYFQKSDAIKAIDLFCGAGGFSEGLKQAVRELGFELEEAAINHDPTAIASHKENHEEAIQYNCDINSLKPIEVVKDLTGDRNGNIDLLLAGPECTQFSTAGGNTKVEEQSRMSSWQVIEWVEKTNVDSFIIENVQDITGWGPTDSEGRPTRDGSIFKAWVNSLNSLGYSIKWTTLDADEFGDPTFRTRFFIIGQKDNKVTFPKPTHSNENEELPNKRTANEVINWENTGSSIWTRDLTNNRIHTPPKDTTLKRISKGIKRHCSEELDSFADVIFELNREKIKTVRNKYVLKPKEAEIAANHLNTPFLVEIPKREKGLTQNSMILRQQDGAHPTNPKKRGVPTISTSGGHQLVTIKPQLLQPFLLPKNGKYGGDFSNSTYKPSEQPTNTITGSPQLSIVYPLLTPTYPDKTPRVSLDGKYDLSLTTNPPSEISRSATDKIVNEGKIDIPSVDMISKYATNTDLVLCLPEMWPLALDIKYRMLEPNELKQAQGFDESYTIKGTKGEQKSQIGNAVPVNLAKNLCKHVLTTNAPSLSTFGGGNNQQGDVQIMDYKEVANCSEEELS